MAQAVTQIVQDRFNVQSRPPWFHNRPSLFSDGMSDADDVEFVTNKRTWICLEEKGVAYKINEIGLYGAGGKPAWFMKMNPKGLVPVLRHQDKVIVESDDICTYVDENFGESGSLQRDSKTVASARQLVNQRVLPAAKAFIHGGSADKMHDAFGELEALIRGPYMTGEDFSLADVSAVPMFQRLMEDSRHVGLDKSKYPKICAWFEACQRRGSVSKTRSVWWWW